MVFRGIEEIELIRIIVDSGSDLLPEVACEHNIQVLPLLANVNGVEYRDGIDLARDGFYALLEETGAFPKTSQVSPHAFAEAFKDCLLYTSNPAVPSVTKRLSRLAMSTALPWCSPVIATSATR